MAERYDVSDTQLAACVSGLFVDIDIVTAVNRQKILDRCALRRQRQRCRRENTPDPIDFSGLYFDGKIDEILQINGTKVKEEHITILNEPGNEYVCHAVADGHISKDIFNAIINSISDADLQKVKAIGVDGTNTNTGRKGGAVTLIEQKLQRKCHWNVCMPISYNEYVCLYIKLSI